MSRENMLKAMRGLMLACREQWNSHDSCKACPLYDNDREQLYDEDGQEATIPKCNANYPTVWDGDGFWPELKEDGKS